jgi:cyclophilin family peptidyl-prolyl cis-trans isomerase
MRTRLPVLAAAFAAAAAAFLPARAGSEAHIQTSMGEIVLTLDAAKAPLTVANFVRYAKEGHYNGTVFYRVVPGFVIQAGSMGSDGKWRPTRKPVALESGNGLSNKRGTIAMAREAKPASATAEFFINLADANARGLDPEVGTAPNTSGYAVFGQVKDGMAVVDAIAAVPVGGKKGPFPGAMPKKPVIITKVSIVTVPDAPATAPAAAEPAAPAEPVAHAEPAAPAHPAN